MSSFFIGLSFCAGLFAGNVAPSIQDFLARVNTWDGKKRPMEMSVKVLRLNIKAVLHHFFHYLAVGAAESEGYCYPL